MSDGIRKKNWIFCVCPLCPCQLSVCGKLSLCYHWSVFLLFSIAESLWGPSSGDTPGQTFTFTLGQSCSFFHSNMENTWECLWSDHALIKWHSSGPLIRHSRKPPGMLGTAEDVQPVGLWGDESTEHLRRGMASVISLSPSSQLSSHRCSVMVPAQDTWAPGTVLSYRPDPSLFALFSSG